MEEKCIYILRLILCSPSKNNEEFLMSTSKLSNRSNVHDALHARAHYLSLVWQAQPLLHFEKEGLGNWIMMPQSDTLYHKRKITYKKKWTFRVLGKKLAWIFPSKKKQRGCEYFWRGKICLYVLQQGWGNLPAIRNSSDDLWFDFN